MMKKIFSLLVALLLLVGAVFALASCGDLSVDEVTKEPHTVLTQAFQQTSAEFFTDDADVGDIVADAIAKGSTTVSFKGTEALGMLTPMLADIEVTGVAYSDVKNDRYALEVLVDVGEGEPIEAVLFIDEDGIVLDAPDIVGADKAYGIGFDGIADKVADSKLVEFFGGIEADDLEDVKEVLNTVEEEYKKLFEADKEAANEFILEIYNALKFVATEGSVTVGEDEVEVIALNLEFTDKTLEAVCDAIVDRYVSDEKEALEAKAEIDKMISDITSQYNIDLSVVVNVDKATKKLANVVVAGSIEPVQSNDMGVELDASLAITKEKLTVEGSAQVSRAGVKTGYGFALEGTKTVDEKKAKYEFALDLSTTDAEGKTVNYNDMFKLAFNYDMETGAYSLEADVSDTKLSLSGKIVKDDKSVAISITKVGMGVEIPVDLSITFEAGAEMPEKPEAKDLLELTEEEVNTLIEDFQTSKIGSLIFG